MNSRHNSIKSCAYEFEYSAKIQHTPRKDDDDQRIKTFDAVYAKTRTEEGHRTIGLFSAAEGCADFSIKAAEKVSESIIKHCKEFFASDEIILSSKPKEDLLTELFKKISTDIYSLEEQETLETYASLTTVLITENQMYAGHIGSGRVYLLRDSRLDQITVDQSLIIRPLDTPDGPKGIKKVIIRRMGGEDYIPPHFYKIELKPKDKILICTDGLSSSLRDNEISQILNSDRSPSKICRQLIDQAQLRGLEDDASAIVVIVKSKTIEKLNTTVKPKAISAPQYRLSMEKPVRFLFVLVFVTLLLFLLALVFQEQLDEYLSSRDSSKEDAVFIMDSQINIESFIHDNTDKTRFLSNNRGQMRLNKEVNRFQIVPLAPSSVYSITLKIQKPMEIHIETAAGNVINIDNKELFIWVEPEARVTINNLKKETPALVLIHNVKGTLNINMQSPVGTYLKIK